MFSQNHMGRILCALLGMGLMAGDASAVTLYRIGQAFTAVEKDSLSGLGIDFREIEWSASQFEEQIEVDSLQAGTLQPNFFDPEENIAFTIPDRDGWVGVRNFANINKLLGEALVDNDSSTSTTWLAIAAESFDQQVGGAHAGLASRLFSEQVTFNLGGRFLIREFRMRPLADKPEHYLESLRISVSDNADYTFSGNSVSVFETHVADIEENTEPEIRIVLPQPVITDAVQMWIYRVTPKEIGLADVEILGGGFVDQAGYESEVIELDDIASLGEISWSGRQDPHAQVAIRTRAGTDPQPDIFWQARPEQQDSVRFLGGGGDLTLAEYKSQYDRVSDLLKPAELKDQVTADVEHWSFWSSPYDFTNPGVAIASPGPRKFVQLKVDFASAIEDGGKVDFIEFKATSPPAVRELIGEIFPIETEVGKPTRFTYFISPTIGSGDSSFDGVEISTPSGVESIDSLRIDAVDQGVFESRIRDDGSGFEVLLPRKLDQTDSGALVEVVFSAPVLREVGTLFNGRVFDTSRPNEVRQRVVPGNAANEIDSDQLSVRTKLSKSLVFSPLISPNPFTPNGDGVNDVANISYKLLRITSAVPVAIEIFDLSGRLVKQVYAGEDPLGEYVHNWDGTDQANGRVPPGLYLYRIAADVQLEKETQSGTVAVAY